MRGRADLHRAAGRPVGVGATRRADATRRCCRREPGVLPSCCRRFSACTSRTCRTVVNNPEEFRVRKQVLREGKQRAEWVQLRKGVAYLFRYREVSLQANACYLDALAAVDDPTKGKQALQHLTTRGKDTAGRSCPGEQCRWRNSTPICSRA